MFTVYFTFHGIQASTLSTNSGDGLHPIGVLALTATALSLTAWHLQTYHVLTHVPGGTMISYALN